MKGGAPCVAGEAVPLPIPVSRHMNCIRDMSFFFAAARAWVGMASDGSDGVERRVEQSCLDDSQLQA